MSLKVGQKNRLLLSPFLHQNLVHPKPAGEFQRGDQQLASCCWRLDFFSRHQAVRTLDLLSQDRRTIEPSPTTSPGSRQSVCVVVEDLVEEPLAAACEGARPHYQEQEQAPHFPQDCLWSLKFYLNDPHHGHRGEIQSSSICSLSRV